MRDGFVAEADFRPLTSDERDVIQVLLAEPFPGRDELAAQLRLALGRTIDNEGSVELSVGRSGPAPVLYRVPVEGETLDPDGMRVHLLLHVVDGYAHELDVYREDSAPRESPIHPANIIVTAYPIVG